MECPKKKKICHGNVLNHIKTKFPELLLAGTLVCVMGPGAKKGSESPGNAGGAAAQSTGRWAHTGCRRESCLRAVHRGKRVSPTACVLSVCRYQCFKSAWMFEVFHRGFSFPVNYKNLKTALQVYDKEVQWTLGAILYRTRFLPLRYGCEFDNENQTKGAPLHLSCIMAPAVCDRLGLCHERWLSQNCRVHEVWLCAPCPSSLSHHVPHRRV